MKIADSELVGLMVILQNKVAGRWTKFFKAMFRILKN